MTQFLIDVVAGVCAFLVVTVFIGAVFMPFAMIWIALFAG